jgi:hypothetical protein
MGSIWGERDDGNAAHILRAGPRHILCKRGEDTRRDASAFRAPASLTEGRGVAASAVACRAASQEPLGAVSWAGALPRLTSETGILVGPAFRKALSIGEGNRPLRGHRLSSGGLHYGDGPGALGVRIPSSYVKIWRRRTARFPTVGEPVPARGERLKAEAMP